WDSTAARGAKAAVADDRVVLDVPKASDGEALSFAKSPLVGDFDVVLDYALLVWTPGAEASVTLRALFADEPLVDASKTVAVARSADGDGDRVIVEPPGRAAPVEKSAVRGTTGAWRVRRSGTTW